MWWTRTRGARRRAAALLATLWTLQLAAPLARAASPAPPPPPSSKILDLPELGRNAADLMGGALGAAGTLSGSAVGATGALALGTSRQIREAAGEVYDDILEGRLRWVVGPAHNAVLLAPQVHTAARNTRNALRNSMAERRQAQGLRRFQPHLPRDWRAPVRPTRQVVARQFATPFSPTNLALTVGLTVAGGMVVAAQEEDVTWKDALAMAGDRSLWVAIAASGVGYGAASLLAAALLPTGAGLLPLLAPMVVGTVGAIVGWIVGERLGKGDSLEEAFDALSLPSIVGLSVGAVTGVLAGVAVGSMIGGPVGAVLGPIAAVAGTLLFRKLGSRWGEDTAATLDAAADETYRRLLDALDRGDRDRAREHLEELRDLQEEAQEARADASG